MSEVTKAAELVRSMSSDQRAKLQDSMGEPMGWRVLALTEYALSRNFKTLYDELRTDDKQGDVANVAVNLLETLEISDVNVKVFTTVGTDGDLTNCQDVITHDGATYTLSLIWKDNHCMHGSRMPSTDKPVGIQEWPYGWKGYVHDGEEVCTYLLTDLGQFSRGHFLPDGTYTGLGIPTKAHKMVYALYEEAVSKRNQPVNDCNNCILSSVIYGLALIGKLDGINGTNTASATSPITIYEDHMHAALQGTSSSKGVPLS